MTNEMHTTAYRPREDCESHWIYGDVTELPFRAATSTLADLLSAARADLGADAVIELDQELILSLRCPRCRTVEQVLQPISQVSFEAAHCPACGALRETEMTHAITGGEAFLDRTLASVGVPPLHILRANNGREYRFYELTGDLPAALHFNDFNEPSPTRKESIRERIRLGDALRLEDKPANPAHGRVVLRD
jgi:adenylyltransferase/sulfurtransferase